MVRKIHDTRRNNTRRRMERARVRELDECSRRNEKLMAKLLRRLRALNGEEEETERGEMTEKRSSKKEKKERTKETESVKKGEKRITERIQ